MKKILALALCACAVFCFSGCQKKATAESMERKITQQLIDAKYIDSDVFGTIGVNMGNMGYRQLSVSGNVKTDTSSGFPKLNLDGTLGIEGLMSLPFKMYMDENKSTINLLGQTQETPINEDTKSKITNAINLASQNQADISRTVKETTYNDMKALEIDYDINQLNMLLSASGAQNDPNKKTTVEQMKIYYLLNENNDIHSCVINASSITGTDKTEINLTIKFNSIGQPLNITSDQTENTQQSTSSQAA